MNSRRQHLRQHLDLRLSQKLALTPSLLQKIELLQLNKLELQEMLNEELVSNPVLEEVLEPEAPKDLGLDGTDEAAPAAEVTPPESGIPSTKSTSVTSSTSTSTPATRTARSKTRISRRSRL